MNNMLLRAITGTIYVALIVCSIIWGGSLGFPALCVLFALLATIEFHTLTSADSHPLLLGLDIIGAFVITSTPLVVVTSIARTSILAIPTVIGGMLVVFVFYLLARLIAQLYLTGKSPLTSWTASLAGQLYISLPLALAAGVYLLSGPAFALTMFIMIWLNDTGAYVVGSRIGRRKLFERISPKKSWEGFFGGMAFCIIASIIIYYCGDNFQTHLSLPALIIYGVLASIIATWGDLVESLIKRTLGVKDSGRMMPGHGGILDRIDSLLFVAPFTFCYLIILLLI